MGSAMSCDRCPTAATSSVVNLSDNLILRMVDGIEPPKSEQLVSAQEQDWIDKLKCLDDAHSSAYGLTFKEMEILMIRVEERVRAGILINHCPSDVLKGCYKHNEKCTLKCSKEVDEFIDCLDAKRLQRLQIMVEEAKKKKDLAEKAAKAKRRKSK